MTRQVRPWRLIEAPSVLGLTPSGVQDLPRVLRAAGLDDALRPAHVARVASPPYDDRRDPITGMLNTAGIAAYTRRLADAVGAVLDRGERPLVLGGDCSILLGNLLALARRGRYGLLFLDAHADFYQPSANINGQAASSELAFATGRGPAALTRFADADANDEPAEDERAGDAGASHARAASASAGASAGAQDERWYPLVREAHVAALGLRDGAEADSYGSQPLPDAMFVRDLWTLRRVGAARAADAALAHLRAQALDGIWLHFDADVLDDAIMPAVDYQLPDGLSWAEAETILRAALATDAIVGLDVTIFNPRLDPSGDIARALAALLARALTTTD